MKAINHDYRRSLEIALRLQTPDTTYMEVFRLLSIRKQLAYHIMSNLEPLSNNIEHQIEMFNKCGEDIKALLGL